LQTKAKPKKTKELKLVAMGMYYVQPIFEDDSLRMKNKLPSHLAIMKGDEWSVSNPKEAGTKHGAFMTPTLSHRIR
jgi:hypothetical protein